MKTAGIVQAKSLFIARTGHHMAAVLGRIANSYTSCQVSRTGCRMRDTRSANRQARGKICTKSFWKRKNLQQKDKVLKFLKFSWVSGQA